QVMAHRESLLLLIKSRLSAATLKEVIVHAPLGVVRLAADLTIIDVNPRFGSMLGTSAADAIGTPIGRFFPPEELTLVADQLRTLSDPAIESTENETQGVRT